MSFEPYRLSDSSYTTSHAAYIQDQESTQTQLPKTSSHRIMIAQPLQLQADLMLENAINSLAQSRAQTQRVQEKKS